jgi:hypothetical protein
VWIHTSSKVWHQRVDQAIKLCAVHSRIVYICAMAESQSGTLGQVQSKSQDFWAPPRECCAATRTHSLNLQIFIIACYFSFNKVVGNLPGALFTIDLL